MVGWSSSHVSRKIKEGGRVEESSSRELGKGEGGKIGAGVWRRDGERKDCCECPSVQKKTDGNISLLLSVFGITYVETLVDRSWRVSERFQIREEMCKSNIFSETIG